MSFSCWSANRGVWSRKALSWSIFTTKNCWCCIPSNNSWLINSMFFMVNHFVCSKYKTALTKKSFYIMAFLMLTDHSTANWRFVNCSQQRNIVRTVKTSFYEYEYKMNFIKFLVRVVLKIFPPVIKVSTVADVILIEIMSKLQITLLSVNKQVWNKLHFNGQEAFLQVK